MTAPRSLLVLCAVVCIPGAAAAQAPPVLAAAVIGDSAGARYQGGGESRGGPGATEEWTRTFRVGPSGALDLSNIAGDIVVTGGEGDEIRVQALKRVRGRKGQDTQGILARVVIEATETPGRVEIRTIYPRGENVHAKVDYMVHVPAATSVTVRSVASDVQVSNVKGEVRAESVSGDVLVKHAVRVEKAKSVSGDVMIAEAGAGDVLSASTVSGGLVLKGVKARAVEAQTVSGDVLLQNAACDRVQAKSVSGGITFDGALTSGGRYEFTSHSGDVRVVVLDGIGFQVAANTFSGNLRSDIPFTGAAQPAVQEAGGFPGHRQLRGTVGDGSALVVMKTFSGSAIVSRKGKQ